MKSVLLPVDEDSLRSVISDVQEDAQNTSWLQLLYRVEAVSILILIPSLAILGGVFINELNLGWQNIKTIGPQYAIGALLLFIAFIAKSLFWIVQKINTGESVWGIERENYFSIFGQVVISLAFISLPIYTILNIDAEVNVLVTLSVFSFVILGCLIAGISGVLSTICLIQRAD